MRGLAEIVAGWPIVASMAMAIAAGGRRVGRRRAVEEAMHELRRPLQSLLLAADCGHVPSAVGGSARLAGVALARLEREVSGDSPRRRRELVAPRPLAEAAVRRWTGRVGLAGGSLELRWRAGEALLCIDRFDLAQALDNLICNAIEHGGPAVVVDGALTTDGALRLEVSDSGRASRQRGRQLSLRLVVRSLRGGGRRHGHGLRVVRRTVARHGGRFRLRCSEGGSRAVVELPLARAEREPRE
jgi:signal transduction histidine kinase